MPESVATGIGPKCAKVMGIDLKSVAATLIEKLAALVPAETVADYDPAEAAFQKQIAEGEEDHQADLDAAAESHADDEPQARVTLASLRAS